MSRGKQEKKREEGEAASTWGLSGKAPAEFFEQLIYPKLGAPRSEVLVGPHAAVDTCAIRLGESQVLVATTDPISLIPVLGPADSAWMSVNLLCNDLATSGFKPQYLLLDFNLPPEITTEIFSEYWNALHAECLRLGIAVVGGHTGKFQGCNYTILGAGTMFATGSAPHLTSMGGQLGDDVILTKGAAISTTGILAKVFPNTIREKLGEDELERASKYFRQISAVEDALTAASVGIGKGGITAMHDVTEGGAMAALYELARASSLGVLLDKEKIRVSEETRAVCYLFQVDPYLSLGEGALVISCFPGKTRELLQALRDKGTFASVVGNLLPPRQGIKVRELDGSEKEVQYPVVDPYWEAYYRATAAGLS